MTPLAQDALRLAFQLYAVDLVVDADDITTKAEAAFRDRLFPDATLRQHGFVDADGRRTPRFQEAAVRALDVLPRQLTELQKQELVARVFDAAVVDDEFRLGEGSVVLMAARLLGIDDESLDSYLARRQESRGVTVAMLDE